MTMRQWLAGLVLGCVTAAAVGQAIEYAENFDNWTEGYYLPLGATVDSNYWFCDVANNYASMSDWAPSMRLWNWGAGTKDANAWRDFRAAGELGENGFIGSPVVQSTLGNGGVGSNADSTLWSRIWVEDGAGNGYMGKINRPGTMAIYRVDGGILKQVAYREDIGWGGLVPDGDAKIMRLTTGGGAVTLSFNYPGESTVYSLSAADTSYRAFTKIGFGGHYGYGESHAVDDVSLTGSIVPPPATVVGKIAAQGFLGDNETVALKIEFRPTAGGEVIGRKVDLNADGSFAVENIPADIYSVAIHGGCWLATAMDNVQVLASPTDLGTITLQGGDSNGDNTVSFEDFSILQNNYGQSGLSGAGPLAAATTGGCGSLGVLLMSILGLAVLALRNE